MNIIQPVVKLPYAIFIEKNCIRNIWWKFQNSPSRGAPRIKWTPHAILSCPWFLESSDHLQQYSRGQPSQTSVLHFEILAHYLWSTVKAEGWDFGNLKNWNRDGKLGFSYKARFTEQLLLNKLFSERPRLACTVTQSLSFFCQKAKFPRNHQTLHNCTGQTWPFREKFI